MTLLVACLGTLACLTIGTFAIGVASTYVDKAQAQTAADAAALAAVAESTPYGTSDPRSAAQRFARLNAARLERCLCEPGATAVQVTVSVDGVVARARAVYEPELVQPSLLTASTAGLHPILEEAVDQLMEHSEGKVWLASGFRSASEQERLWREAVARYGDPEVADDWVAPPGTSMHERGLAVDLGGDLGHAADLIARLGLPLVQPLANEPWHFELRAAGQRSQ